MKIIRTKRREGMEGENTAERIRIVLLKKNREKRQVMEKL